MNHNDLQDRHFINRGFGSRSPMTRKSFSHLPKSVSEFNPMADSLFEKYDKETEAIHLDSPKKKFNVSFYAVVVGILLVITLLPSIIILMPRFVLFSRSLDQHLNTNLCEILITVIRTKLENIVWNAPVRRSARTGSFTPAGEGTFC
jgi:hypothetical protein